MHWTGKANGHPFENLEGEQIDGCLLQHKPALTSGHSLSFQPSCLSMTSFPLLSSLPPVTFSSLMCGRTGRLENSLRCHSSGSVQLLKHRLLIRHFHSRTQCILFKSTPALISYFPRHPRTCAILPVMSSVLLLTIPISTACQLLA